MAEPGRAPLVRVPSGACSRADAKGEGAPTGMSATTAVAGRPIYTSPAYGESAPKAFRAKPETETPARNCAFLEPDSRRFQTSGRAAGSLSAGTLRDGPHDRPPAGNQHGRGTGPPRRW